MSILDIFHKKRPYVFSDEERGKSANTRLLNSIKRQRLEMEQEELSAQREQLNHYKQILEQKRLQREIDRIENELYDDESDEEDDEKSPALDMSSPEAMFMNVISQLMQNRQNVSPQSQPQLIETSSKMTSSSDVVTEDIIKKKVDEIPKTYLEQAKKLSDKDLATNILKMYPSLSDELVIKTIEYVRNAK